eukprot:14701199-Alexandrium_andersonii.AAC.1
MWALSAHRLISRSRALIRSVRDALPEGMLSRPGGALCTPNTKSSPSSNSAKEQCSLSRGSSFCNSREQGPRASLCRQNN